MSRLHFSDFEPYCATIANADLRMRVLGFERPQYAIAHAAVGRFQMQCADEGSGQLTEGVTDRHAAGLYVQLNERPRIVNGMAIDPNAVVYFPPGSDFCFACDHANSWFSVRVPLDVLVDGDSDPDKGAGLPDSISIVRPDPRLVRQLRSMVLQYLGGLEATPSLARSAAATAAFDHKMTAIARQIARPVAAHRTIESSRPSSPDVRRQRIASETAELIEATLGGRYSVEGLAQRLDVSESTLLKAFHSRFGMSPRRFIQAMRLNKSRELLRRGDPARVRISSVAAECGYWDFGRFASRYRTLFGELPSETLKR